MVHMHLHYSLNIMVLTRDKRVDYIARPWVFFSSPARKEGGRGKE